MDLCQLSDSVAEDLELVHRENFVLDDLLHAG
jgi:hypothetical protein